MARLIKARLLLVLTGVLLVLPLAQSAVLAQDLSPRLVVNTYRLNVRSGPGVGNNIITVVAGGTELPVTLIGLDGVWYQVDSSAGIGWVNSRFGVTRGNFSSVPRQSAHGNLGGGVEVPAGSPHVVVNTAYLNVRTGPGIGNDILTTVPGGTTLPVTRIAQGNVWYEVTTTAGSGWLNRTYTVTRGDFSDVPRDGAPAPVVTGGGVDIPAGAAHVVVNTSFLNIRTGPGIGNDVLIVVSGGTKLPVIGLDSSGKWYEVQSSAGIGWLHSAYVVPRGDFSSITRAGVAPKEGAELSGNTPRAVVNTFRLNIRTGPGAGNDIVTSVQGGTILKILGKSASGNWYLVEGSFGQGWLNNHYVVFRGDYSQVSVVS